jgi:hypothetical protein
MASQRCDRAVRDARGDAHVPARRARALASEPRARAPLWSAIVLLAGAVAAQEAEPKRPCVALLGASVTNGFVDSVTAPAGENRTIPLRTAFRAAWAEDRARVVDFSDVLMFTAPVERGRIQVGRAARAHPDLVLAADFAFWFGYGAVSRNTPSEQLDARLALQREGLALLDRIECPMIVGDYPDMRGADPNMLAPHQIPTPDMLARLNEELSEWASARPRVRVFRLSDWVAKIRSDTEAMEYRGRRVRLPAHAVLQTDRLHANRLGAVLLAHRLLELIPPVLGAKHALSAELPDLTELVDRLDVEEHLEPSAPAPAALEDKQR